MPTIPAIVDDRQVGRIVFTIYDDFLALETHAYRFQGRPKNYQDHLEAAGMEEIYPVCFVHDIAVDKDFTNRGLATKLLAEMEKACLAEGCRFAFL